MGAGGLSISDLDVERFNVVSFPDNTLGRTDFLYQTNQTESSFNGQQSPPAGGAQLDLNNTANRFRTSVNTLIPGSVLEVNVELNDALELRADYEAMAAGASETFMGSIEAVP